MTTSIDITDRSARYWALGALVFSVTLVGLKMAAFALTGSVAILADALESTVNIVTSAFSLYAVRLSTTPRDADHPYGHGKIEYLSAATEGLLVAGAGVAILVVAAPSLWNPQLPTSLSGGALFVAAIAAATGVGGAAIRRAGRRLESPALEADGKHLLADSVTSLVVLGAIAAVYLTRFPLIDPLVAVLLAIFLVVQGARIVRESIGGIMDEASPQLLDRIGAALERVRQPGWVSPHHVKVHRLGMAIHVDLHLVFPRFWSLEEAHDASERIEASMIDEFGARTETMVHMEPCTSKSCRFCTLEGCPVRAVAFDTRREWNHKLVSRPFRHDYRELDEHH